MGRASRCWRRPDGGEWCRGKIVNAYVREGTPSKWRAVGKVCTKCYTFRPLSKTP